MNAPARLREAVAAAAILAIGMGFGRFSFTAIYPHMLGDGALTLRDDSLAASANYAGYLLGAILAMRALAPGAHRLCLWSVAGTALCLGALALTMPVWLFVTVPGAAAESGAAGAGRGLARAGAVGRRLSAQRAAVKAGASMMAIMTVVYSVGQIIGPVLAGSLQAQSHSFSSALLSAAVALLLAMIVSLRL